MANLNENIAQFEYQKMQFIGSLQAVAETMRNSAAYADQYAQMVAGIPIGASLPNGQFAMVAPGAQLATGRKRKARGDTEKKPRKKKDPNAPKRPASSYLLFQNEVRAQLKTKNPTMPNNELLGTIAKLWSEMPKEKKEEYEARQKAAKETWLAQKAVYESGPGPAAHGEMIAAAAPVAAPAPAIIKAVEVPTIETASSSDDSDEDEDAESSADSEEDEEEEEAPPPPPKKVKKSAESSGAAKAEPVKEKKQKKAKV